MGNSLYRRREMADIGLLTLRLVVGLYLFGHGTQKLFGWFGGPGLRGHAQNMTRLGFRPAALWATASTAGEIGGLLLALGFLSPLGSLGVAASMPVSYTHLRAHETRHDLV